MNIPIIPNKKRGDGDIFKVFNKLFTLKDRFRKSSTQTSNGERGFRQLNDQGQSIEVIS